MKQRIISSLRHSVSVLNYNKNSFLPQVTNIWKICFVLRRIAWNKTLPNYHCA